MNKHSAGEFRRLFTVSLLTGIFLLTGCRTWSSYSAAVHHRASSVVNYLYPENSEV